MIDLEYLKINFRLNPWDFNLRVLTKIPWASVRNTRSFDLNPWACYRNPWFFDRNYWDFEQILEISTKIIWDFDHSPWYFDQMLKPKILYFMNAFICKTITYFKGDSIPSRFLEHLNLRLLKQEKKIFLCRFLVSVLPQYYEITNFMI